MELGGGLWCTHEEFFGRNGIMFAALLLGSVVGQQAVHSQAEPKLANSPESLTPFIVKSAWLKFGIYDGRILAKDIRRLKVGR